MTAAAAPAYVYPRDRGGEPDQTDRVSIRIEEMFKKKSSLMCLANPA